METQTQREGLAKTEGEIGMMWPRAKKCLGLLGLEEARKDCRLELQRECGLQNLDFRRLASGTVRKYISAVSRQPGCGALLRQP